MSGFLGVLLAIDAHTSVVSILRTPANFLVSQVSL